MTTAPTRPVLRYHGGKWLLAPWIISHLPPHRTYVEPYGGAASVLLRKPRAYAEVYNDLWGEVVTLFRVLRSPALARELDMAVRLTPFSREEFTTAYEPVPLTRSRMDGTVTDPVEQARRLLVRSFMGFGSAASNGNHTTGFRADVRRSGTTPARDWMNWPNEIVAMSLRLQGVVIEQRPAIELIRSLDDEETCFFVDPPYMLKTRASSVRRNNCYEYEMSDADHSELAGTLHACRGMVVLSGYLCEEYDGMYGGWRRVERRSFADGARERTECLWLNPATVARLPLRLEMDEDAT
jgi:DNA adenine methylase